MSTHLPDIRTLSSSAQPSSSFPTTTNLPPNPSNPTRPKHLSTRSISDIASIPKVHRHHHHLHHHHKDKEKEGREGKEKRDGKEGKGDNFGASNLSLRVGGGGGGGTGEESGNGNGSRRGSVNVSVNGMGNGSGDKEKGGWEDSVGMGVLQREKRVVKEGEVGEERERGFLRATELRNALMGLNTLSNNTTRRLDNSYYSVLEKLSLLQTTISSLKELASMTKGLNQEFKDDSEDLVKDISVQLEGFENFSEQEKKIGDLQQRVKAGRERIKILGTRVDIVKDRVEGWEKAEGEWQERTRKNLRILWILISCVMAVFLAIVAFQYTPAMNGEEMNDRGLNTTGLLGKVPDFESLRNESLKLMREVEERLDAGGVGRGRGQEEESERLRIFDEL